MTKIRKGQSPEHLQRDAFSKRFRASFFDPVFRSEDAAIARLEEITWLAYDEGRNTLDKDELVQEEVRNCARAVLHTVAAVRAGTIPISKPDISRPRPK